MVTHNELTIKGKNPNLPSLGAHSEDVIKPKIEWLLNKPVDFITKPVAIASGSNKKKVRQTIIHLDERLSIIFLLVMLLKFLFGNALSNAIFLCNRHHIIMQLFLRRTLVLYQINQLF